MPLPLPSEVLDQVIDLLYLSALHESWHYTFFYPNLFQSEHQEDSPFYHRHITDEDEEKWDTENLKSCALVCKAWLPRCRFHLFAQFIASSRAQFERRFHIFSRVAPDVCHLSLQDTGDDRWIVEAFTHLTTAFHRITSLELFEVEFHDLEEESLGKIFRPFSALQRLRVCACSFRSSSQVFYALCACPNLHTLEFESEWKHDDHSVLSPTTQKDFPSLISLSPFPAPRILEWLVGADTTLHMKRLRVESISEEELPSLGQTLRLLGPSLEDLDVPCVDEMKFHENVDLSLNDHLRTIRFDVSLHRHGWPGPYMAPHAGVAYYIPRILGQISSFHMQEVTIKTRAPKPDVLDSFHLDEMDRVFARPNFQELQMVRFRLFPNDVEAARVFLGQRMPGCESRGIIVVEG